MICLTQGVPSLKLVVLTRLDLNSKRSGFLYLPSAKIKKHVPIRYSFSFNKKKKDARLGYKIFFFFKVLLSFFNLILNKVPWEREHQWRNVFHHIIPMSTSVGNFLDLWLMWENPYHTAWCQPSASGSEQAMKSKRVNSIPLWLSLQVLSSDSCHELLPWLF